MSFYSIVYCNFDPSHALPFHLLSFASALLSSASRYRRLVSIAIIPFPSLRSALSQRRRPCAFYISLHNFT